MIYLILQVQECIGCAVIVMKPEKVHEFIPISVDPDELTYSNTWLIPIYRDHVVLSSLGFFIRTIVPLSESFMEACKKGSLKTYKFLTLIYHHHGIIKFCFSFLQVEENSEIRKQFESHARGCLGLLPAFCRYPTDVCESFGSLADHMIKWLKKDVFMIEYVGIALQVIIVFNVQFVFVHKWFCFTSFACLFCL